MNRTKILRRIIDLCMIVVLPLLMAYELIGRSAHEWLGVTMLALVIVHQIINRAWYQSLFKGRYSALRIVTVVMDLALILLMILQAISGMSMARHLPDAVPALLRRSVARMIHMTCAYWCFTLMCMHAGFHMSPMIARLRRRMKPFAFAALGMLVCLIASYGVYAFIRRQLPAYMFMQIKFAFFDYEEPLAFFFADYIAIMMLFLLAGHGLASFLKRVKKEHKK